MIVLAMGLAVGLHCAPAVTLNDYTRMSNRALGEMHWILRGVRGTGCIAEVVAREMRAIEAEDYKRKHFSVTSDVTWKTVTGTDTAVICSVPGQCLPPCLSPNPCPLPTTGTTLLPAQSECMLIRNGIVQQSWIEPGWTCHVH